MRADARRFQIAQPLWAIFVVMAAVLPLSAQQFTSLMHFDNTDGSAPTAALVQGPDGNFYGTTATGGTYNSGTVFKLTPGGQLTSLHSFNFVTEGYIPYAGLVLANDGNFYGTTSQGGASGNAGTIFKMTPAGLVSTFYKFCSLTNCTDGEQPTSTLVQGSDGDLYGMTGLGGHPNGAGTVFRINLSGNLSVIHNFCQQAGCTDGSDPIGPLVEGSDGDFYGTTYGGGPASKGTIFKVSPSGQFTSLYNFCLIAGCSDGQHPLAGLVQGNDGNFYGTIPNGGKDNFGGIFSITSNGQFTLLFSFDYLDGESPQSGLLLATDGNFYGTTQIGGTNGYGTIFKTTSSGQLSTVHNFCNQLQCPDGSIGDAALTQGTNGAMYGTTEYGGVIPPCRGAFGGCGTLFRLGTGMGAFVQTAPTSGVVGSTVLILGNNLNGTNSLTFNGVAAPFTVISNTEIQTKVPAGASTGLIQVVTPGGTLDSNVAYRVAK